MKVVLVALVLFYIYCYKHSIRNALRKILERPNLSEHERKITERAYELEYYLHDVFVRPSYQEVPYRHRTICFVTYEDRDHPYIKLHDKNLAQFCKRYDYVYLKKTSYKKGTTYWKKLFLLQDIINEDKYDYVFWLDSDTIINQKTDTDTFISKYGEKDIIVGIEPFSFLWQNINAGIIGIKNSKIGKQFLSDCIQIYHEQYPYCIKDGKEQGGFSGPCYEQGVMNKVIKSKYKDDVYIDTKHQWILHRGVFNFQSPEHFLHLRATPNHVRKRVFQKYVN